MSVHVSNLKKKQQNPVGRLLPIPDRIASTISFVLRKKTAALLSLAQPLRNLPESWVEWVLNIKLKRLATFQRVDRGKRIGAIRDHYCKIGFSSAFSLRHWLWRYVGACAARRA